MPSGSSDRGQSDMTDRIDSQHRGAVVPLEDHADLGDTDDRPDPVTILTDQNEHRVAELVPMMSSAANANS